MTLQMPKVPREPRISPRTLRRLAFAGACVVALVLGVEVSAAVGFLPIFDGARIALGMAPVRNPGPQVIVTYLSPTPDPAPPSGRATGSSPRTTSARAEAPKTTASSSAPRVTTPDVVTASPPAAQPPVTTITILPPDTSTRAPTSSGPLSSLLPTTTGGTRQ